MPGEVPATHGSMPRYAQAPNPGASTPPAGACNTPSHDVEPERRPAAARLSSRQPQGDADPCRARPDREQGADRLHLRGGGAGGRREPGGALPAFPRSRRIAGAGGAARICAIGGRAAAGLERRDAGPARGVRADGPCLSGVRPHAEPAYYAAMFEGGVPLDASSDLRKPPIAPLRRSGLPPNSWSRWSRRHAGRRR